MRFIIALIVAAAGAAAIPALTGAQTSGPRDLTVVISGLVKFTALDDLEMPIVGGSGAYRGATGDVGSGAPIEGYDSVDVLHLDA